MIKNTIYNIEHMIIDDNLNNGCRSSNNLDIGGLSDNVEELDKYSFRWLDATELVDTSFLTGVIFGVLILGLIIGIILIFIARKFIYLYKYIYINILLYNNILNIVIVFAIVSINIAFNINPDYLISINDQGFMGLDANLGLHGNNISLMNINEIINPTVDSGGTKSSSGVSGTSSNSSPSNTPSYSPSRSQSGFPELIKKLEIQSDVTRDPSSDVTNISTRNIYSAQWSESSRLDDNDKQLLHNTMQNQPGYTLRNNGKTLMHHYPSGIDSHGNFQRWDRYLQIQSTPRFVNHVKDAASAIPGSDK